jgi:hypothetical protein
MADQKYSYDLDADTRALRAAERDRLVLDLKDRVGKLNDQARIFIPLIALCLIVAIPVWSKSLGRFVILLLSPFVLLPVGFSVVHLALAWRGITKARNRIRDWEHTAKEAKVSDNRSNVV